MLETAVIDLLRTNTEIERRISRPGGVRAHLGAVPQGQSIEGGTIVVKKISSEYDYGLDGEAPSRFTVLQIDSYDLTPTDADSLGELVRGELSGYIGQPNTESDPTLSICSTLIVNERTEHEKPKGATDNWRPRDSRDYQFHITNDG